MELSRNWDLTKLYKSFESDEFKSDMIKVKESLDMAAAWADKELKNNGDVEKNLLQSIKITDEIHRLLHRLGAFTNLTIATEATNETALGMMDRLELLMLDAQILSATFRRYIGGIDNLQEVIEASKKLKEYDYYLNERYRESKHLLPDEVEKAVARLSITGSNAFSRMRDMIDGTMMVDIEVDGEAKSLPLPMIRNMAYSPDATVRKNAFEAELAAYKKIELPLSHALNAIKGENIAECQMRGYESILGRTLESSRMSKEVLDAMLSAIVDALPDFRRYLKAKATLLGHKNGLPFYDLFAPVGKNNNEKYTYEQAHTFLVDTFKGFSTQMSDFIDYAFRNRWIDAEPREGKSGGAFCANLMIIGESRILSNFDGSLSGISTLAHELGHAWHGNCLKHLPLLNTSYPMPLAETASIFNEGIVIDAIMKKATDEEKMAIIESELMDSTQVIVDIYSRYLFESRVIEVRHDHSMSVKEMKEAMLDAQEKAYGDGLDKNTMHPYMWACKGHYYIPELAFYNWPYAFGLLFAKCIFEIYKSTGNDFLEKYKELLAATGSADVVDVAKMMDVDLTQKSTWKKALDGIVEKIDIFCELAKSK